MGRVRPYRATPRRRDAPRWSREEWSQAGHQLALRSGGRCECCGKEPTMWGVDRHHRQRRAVGGDRLANVVVLRHECHQYWTEHPAEAMDRGLIVSSYVGDVAGVPMLWRGFRLVVLDDDGTLTGVPAPTTVEQ